LPNYNLRFNKPYRRRVKFLFLKKSLSLKLLKLKILKEILWASKRNKTPMIKSIGLDLNSTIKADSNLITLWEDNISSLCSFKVILVNPRITMGRNLI